MNPSAGYNLHSYSPYFLEHTRKINSRAHVVMNNFDAALTLKRALPDTLVIFRNWGSDGDENDYLQYTPRQWLDRNKQYAVEGIALYVLNEPPFNKVVIEWLIELCKINLEPGYRFTLVLGNWATGNPQPEQWALAIELLQLLAARPDLFILGLHQYAGAVVTSGLYGGWPDNAGVEPGKPGVGKNLIPPANWPKSMLEDGKPISRFHLGREWFLVTFCKREGITPPRIIVTEALFDDTSDIDTWLKRLPASSPYHNVRGFKSLRYQWARWFPDWSIDQAYFEQLKYALEVIWKDSPVEAVCLFCWGHSSQDWEQFDVSGQTEFHQLLETYSASQKDDGDMTFPLPTDPKWIQQINQSGEKHSIRKTLLLETPFADILPGETFWYYPGLDAENAIIVKNIGGLVGYADRGVLVVKPPKPEPPPVDLAALTAAIPGIAKTADEIAVEMEALTQKRDALRVELAALDEQISAWAHARARLVDAKKLIELFVEDAAKAA